MDGEIEEVENPENPSGPSLFRFVMFKATEKVSHKKKVETDKAKDDTNDFDLAFDDVDLGWTLKASSKALQTISVGKQLSSGSLGSSAVSNTASASGAGAPDEPVQASGKPGPPLAIEDGNERDIVLLKIEEGFIASHRLSLRMSKVIARLPATILASRRKASLEEMDIVMKERASLLKDIVVHGTGPGQSGFIGVNELNNVIKSFRVHLFAVVKAVDTASRARKKVKKQEH